MFIAGTTGVTEPPYNDLWTVEGEQGMLDVWKMEDFAFFKTIDPVGHFFRLQLEDFTQAILNDTTPSSSGEEGMETVKLIEGMYVSGRTGKPVRY